MIDSPVGALSYWMTPEGALGKLWFGCHEFDGPRSEAVEQELREFFRHERTEFTLPLDPRGTSFQRSVWNELLKIPYGETRSYLQIAGALGDPAATRAVGAANGANPIAIVIPCHRVIGANGKLTGYGGGLPIKSQLLEFEQGSLFDPVRS